MSSTVFDLSAYRFVTGSSSVLVHPAGVLVPFEQPSDSILITPQIRSELCSGDYSRDMIELLPEALAEGDRVLVIGAGLGVVATLAAKSGLAERIIAIEANEDLIRHIERVKALNGADRIETVHGVLAHWQTGSVPFFVASDFRNSSLTPSNGNWRRAMRVPSMDLNLILAEERISLIICDAPDVTSNLLANAQFSRVTRILARLPDEGPDCWSEGGICADLAARGYKTPPRSLSQRVALFHRLNGSASYEPCTCGAANTHTGYCPGKATVAPENIRTARGKRLKR